MLDLMIDLETLGRGPAAQIVSIGAVAFDRNGKPGSVVSTFYCRVRLEGRVTVDADTLEWWMRHADAWPSLDNEAMSLKCCLSSLRLFGLTEEDLCVWSHGASFDVPILTHAFEACAIDVPWHYRDIRDTRTLFDLAGYSYTTEGRAAPGKHHALEDAKAQARAVQEAVRLLRGVQ